MLSKPFLDSVRFAHISLTLVGLMWVLPFLYPDHPHLVPSFYGEWAAAVLGLCAMYVLLMKQFWQQLKIPRIALLPAALLLLVLIQFAFGRGVYFEQSLQYALYLLWAMLLIILGSHLRDELGLPTLTATLALFLLAGAELSALAGLLQHYPSHTIVDVLAMPSDSAAVFGNVAQSNHLANYLTLGLVSLGLLYTRWKMRVWQLLLLAFPMLFVMVLTGSRSPWLYLSFIAGMSFLWQRRDKSFLPVFKYSLLLLLGFGLMNLVVQLPWLVGPHGNQTAMRRLIEAEDFRLSIWRGAWLVILFGTLVLWLVQASRAPRTDAQWWGYAVLAVLAVLAIHSMLEYPLWYAYFMGIAAITLGVLDRTSWRLALRWNLAEWGRWPVLALFLSGLLLLSLMLPDYRKVARLDGLMQQASTLADEYSQQALYRRIHNELAVMHSHVTLLRPYVENLLGDTGWDHMADKRALNERVIRFAPSSVAVHREVMLLAGDGRQEEARVMMERAIWAYPRDFPVMREKLEKLARMDRNPERFPALLDFALQKYKEWQRETHYKGAQ